MNLRQLDHFLRVAELGSLSKAAEDLAISQSGLTKSIQSLEREVGAPLFVRRSRGVAKTEYGETFFRHAIAIRAQSRNAFGDIEAMVSGREGTLAVGTSPNWLYRRFVPIILGFLDDHPGVRLRIETDNAPQLLDALAHGSLDIVFSLCDSASQWQGIEVIPVELDKQGLVVCSDHPLTRNPPDSLADLDRWGWVLPEQGTLFRRRLDIFYLAAGLPPPQPVIEGFSRNFLLSIVAQTQHVGIATQEEVSNIVPGRVVMLDYPFTWMRTVGIMRREGETPSVVLDRLIDRTRAFFAGSEMTS